MIRRLLVGDVEAYRAVRLEALLTDADSFGAVHGVEAALPIEAHARRLESSAVFAAIEGRALVGLVGVQQESGERFVHKALLWGMWTRPSVRGRGVGAALVAAAIDHARPLVAQVHLSVLHRNAAAIGLYGRSGFVEYGLEPRAVRTSLGFEDEVLMARLF